MRLDEMRGFVWHSLDIHGGNDYFFVQLLGDIHFLFSLVVCNR
jgi:hypothetical protein